MLNNRTANHFPTVAGSPRNSSRKPLSPFCQRITAYSLSNIYRRPRIPYINTRVYCWTNATVLTLLVAFTEARPKVKLESYWDAWLAHPHSQSYASIVQYIAGRQIAPIRMGNHRTSAWREDLCPNTLTSSSQQACGESDGNWFHLRFKNTKYKIRINCPFSASGILSRIPLQAPCNTMVTLAGRESWPVS
jgi:hypothetical protein